MHPDDGGERSQNVEQSKADDGQKYGWLSIRPRALQMLNSSRFLLLLLCSYFSANSTVVNGLYLSSISTIEKRFSLSSTRMGMVTSIYDIAALLFTGPVSFFGVRNKPVILGLGIITMGIGYLVFISPHFIAAEYIPVTVRSQQSSNYSSPMICALPGSRAPLASCDAKEGSDVYYRLFMLGMFIAGAGCTPMISVGIPFLDESASKTNAPWYIGLLQTSAIVSAVVGFLLSSVFLSTFVHPTAPVSITEDSSSWVGAWWMGLAIGSAFAFLIGIILTGMPKMIKKEDHNRSTVNEANRKAEAGEGNRTMEHPSIKEIPSVLKRLILKCPTFVLLSIALSIKSFVITGSSAFGAKIALFQFQLTASEVSTYLALSAGTGAILGNLSGSFVLKKFNFSSLGILKIAIMTSIIATILNLNAFIYCDTYPAPGINDLFPNSNATGFSLLQDCNKGCSCQDNFFAPLCNNGMTYANPCVAGCKTMGSGLTFSNCTCVASGIGQSQASKIGFCKTSCGIRPLIFFIVAWLESFTTLFNATPCTVATLRSVPFSLRSFAMGLQWMLVRILGAIPGPVLFGYVIDKSCVFWSKKCSNAQGTCTIYDNKELAINIGVLQLGLNILIVLFISLAYIAERRFAPREKKLAVAAGNEGLTEENRIKNETKL